MIPIGQPCKICKKTHVIKSDEVWDSLSVKENPIGLFFVTTIVNMML
jgi:hypothetical protein